MISAATKGIDINSNQTLTYEEAPLRLVPLTCNNNNNKKKKLLDRRKLQRSSVHTDTRCFGM